MQNYDVIIVGAGPMGIYTAYELMVKAPQLKVLLIDKGHDIYSRNCPILAKKINSNIISAIIILWSISVIFPTCGT